MIVRYEHEVRELINSRDRADEVHALRVQRGETWHGVGEVCQQRWAAGVVEGDLQSLGATLCHVAAEMRGEDPDAPPWN